MDKEWLKSKCVGTWLHRFKVFNITEKYVHEICEICKEEVVFTIVNGMTSNIDYLDYHLHNALTPSHPYFTPQYGKQIQK